MGQLLPTDSPIPSCPHYYLSVLSSPAAEGSRVFPIAEEGRAQTHLTGAYRKSAPNWLLAGRAFQDGTGSLHKNVELSVGTAGVK